MFSYGAYPHDLYRAVPRALTTHPAQPTSKLIGQPAAWEPRESYAGLHTPHHAPWTRRPATPWPRTGGYKRTHRPRRSLHQCAFRVVQRPCEARMSTPQRDTTYHTKMLPGAGTWGPSREYTRNNARTDQHIAPRGVHTHTARPLGPPSCPGEPGYSAQKGGAGSPTNRAPICLPAPPATLRKATLDRRPHK